MTTPFECKLYTRRISYTELTVLMLLSMNNEWRKYIDTSFYKPNKNIILMHGPDYFMERQGIDIYHDLFRNEYLLMTNINNKLLIDYTEQIIYENQEDTLKYTKIIKGICQKCDYNIDTEKVFNMFFKKRLVINMISKKSIPSFQTKKDLDKWVDKNIYDITYFIDSDNKSNDLIELMIINKYKCQQYSFYEEIDDRYDLISIQLEG